MNNAVDVVLGASLDAAWNAKEDERRSGCCNAGTSEGCNEGTRKASVRTAPPVIHIIAAAAIIEERLFGEDDDDDITIIIVVRLFYGRAELPSL